MENKGQFKATIPLETREQAFKLYRRGTSHAESARLLNLSKYTIMAWAKRYSWQARVLAEKAGPPSSRVIRRSELVGDVAKATPSDADALPDQQLDFEAGMQTEALRLPAIMREMSDSDLIKNADKIAKLDAVARKALKLENEKPAIVVNVGLLAGSVGKRLTGSPLPLICPQLHSIEGKHTGNIPALPNTTEQCIEAELVE